MVCEYVEWSICMWVELTDVWVEERRSWYGGKSRDGGGRNSERDARFMYHVDRHVSLPQAPVSRRVARLTLPAPECFLLSDDLKARQSKT